MTWTDDRIETLKRYWQDGYSASQIAQRLGGVTRNAVIGKVHRLGLPGRISPSSRATSTRSRSASRSSRPRAHRRSKGRSSHVRHIPAQAARMRLTVLPQLGPAPLLPITVQSLTLLTCRWPEGDPRRSEFHFCGRTKERADIPYCDHHDAIAHR